MAGFDINSVKGNDRFIAGGAVVLFILSFLPWRSFHDSIYSGHASAWGSGAYGWPKLALLLAFIAGGIVIARIMGALDSVTLPAGINFITLAVSGLASVILLLQFLFGFKHAGDGTFKVTLHPGFGYDVGLLVSLAMSYFAFLSFKSSGEVMPSMPSSGSGATMTPPPASYTPPVVDPTTPTPPFES